MISPAPSPSARPPRAREYSPPAQYLLAPEAASEWLLEEIGPAALERLGAACLATVQRLRDADRLSRPDPLPPMEPS